MLSYFGLALLIINSTFAETQFSLLYIDRDSPKEIVTTQRASINYSHTTSLSENFFAKIDATAHANWSNANRYITQESDEGFNVEVSEFSILKKSSLFNLGQDFEVGVISGLKGYPSLLDIAGPGAKAETHWRNFTARFAYTKLPAAERFYVRSGSSNRQSSLWESALIFNRKDDFYSLGLSFHYLYFSELGAETAYQSGLKGNSTKGPERNSRFVYDFSIFGISAESTFQLDYFEVGPVFTFGINQGAYSYENKYGEIGVKVGRNNLFWSIGYLFIQKNALVAAYTKENIQQSGVSGIDLSLDYLLTKEISFRSYLTSMKTTELSEPVQTVGAQISLWSDL